MSTLDVFAARLKERRLAAGYTQREVGELEGVGQSYISNLENGYQRPKVIEIVADLARLYDTSADYLLGLTDDPTPPQARSSPEIVMLYEAWQVMPAGWRFAVQTILNALADTAERMSPEERQRADQNVLLDLLELVSGFAGADHTIRMLLHRAQTTPDEESTPEDMVEHTA